MPYTSHGHHIPGTILAVRPGGPVARCGGPGLCDKCSAEAYQTLKLVEKTLDTQAVIESPKLETKTYSRRPFEVEAVRVTDKNFEDVAAWCGGNICEVKEHQPTLDSLQGDVVRRYIHLEVDRPLTPRQSQAYVGDWILFASKGFKVYANRPFMKNFMLVETPSQMGVR